MKYSWKISAIVLAFMATAAPAAAASDRDTSEVRVDDLDLRTEQGRERLNHRIGRAARSICGTAGRSVFELRSLKPCLDQVTESAAIALAQARSPDAMATASVERTGRVDS